MTIYADEGCAIDADTIDADTIDADTDVETHTAQPVGARSVVTPPVYTSEERVGLFALIAALFYIASAAAGSTLLGVAAGAALAASVGSAMRSLAEDDTSHRATA